MLTGLFTDPLPSPDTYHAIRGKSIIDLVRHDFDTLARLDMSQADRNKLEAWKAILDIACVDGAPNEVDGTTQATGTDPSLANAPINKYFCNLMNALGVKAGSDGFAAPGGSEPVTHFGMYDRTEDFIGGGLNPPTIHDPGEFAALKASS
ncbi:hypothetical protein WME94_10830 [Sorangium sp. So ce429]